MNNRALPRLLIKVYVGVFLFYMLAPLIVMGGAALNDSRFPSVFPWVGFTYALVRRSVERRPHAARRAQHGADRACGGSDFDSRSARPQPY